MIDERKSRVDRRKQLLSNIQTSEDMVKQQQIGNLIMIDMAETLELLYEQQGAMNYATSLNEVIRKGGKRTGESIQEAIERINKDEDKKDVISLEQRWKELGEENKKRPKDDYGITIFDPTDW